MERKPNDSTPHYVRSYNDMVADLKEKLPLHDAMSRAVGSGASYEKAGEGLAGALIAAGLAPGQTLIESPAYWGMFENMVKNYKQPLTPHLNMFIERPMLEEWAKHLGLRLEIGTAHEGRQTGARLYKS